MPGPNAQLAAIFQQMADISEILGRDRFRTNAYARAARVINDLTDDLSAIGDDLKALTAIDGIGKGTAERIIEYLDAGKVADHEELLSQVPAGLLDLLDIPGLGPKTVALLWKEAGVESKADLQEKLSGDELTKLPGMGKKKIENLRKSIAFTESAGERVRLGQAMRLASWFVDQLHMLKAVKQVDYAGSLRRGRETIGDIDLIVAAAEKDAGAISDHFIGLEAVEQVLVHGPTKSSVRVGGGGNGPAMQVDLRVVTPDQFGAALLYFTGSKEHNIRLRERAIKRDMRLNEYALSKDEKIIASETEQDIYKALGLVWIPPELREDRGEIALAEKDKLPKLLTVKDIKAELHAHTTASDGRWSIRELAAAAAERGFHTIAVTDHSKGQVQAHGLDEARLEKHVEAVRKVAAEMKDTIAVLAGTEVDILADGRLDYSNSVLKELDIVVASPHAALSQDAAKATKRIRKAIDNPHVHIIGHLTGRLINRREGLHPDVKELFAAAAETGTAMEINANSYRLDLRDTHARAALDAGVKLSINTDAHGPGDLDQLYYGILTARRAGVTPDDVVNCLPQPALKKWLKAKHG